MDSRLRDGVRAGLPLALAPLLFGASFGLLAVDAGMGPLGAVVMSATTFAGSAQFAAASILDSGGGAAAAIVAAVLLNARYVPQSLSVASIFPGSRWRRFFEAQLIVDESWALSGRSGRFDYGLLTGVGILLYVLWIGGTAVGTVVGDCSTRRRSGSTQPSRLSFSPSSRRIWAAVARSSRRSSLRRSRSRCSRSRPQACRSSPPASPA